MPSIKRKRSAPEPVRAARLATPPSDDSEEDEFAAERTRGGSRSKSLGNGSRRDVVEEDEDDEDEDDEDEGDLDEDEGDREGIARWEPDELDGHEEDETDEDDGESEGEDVDDEDESEEEEDPAEVQSLAKLQRDLEQIPLQTLLKANKKLRKGPAPPATATSTANKERALLEAKHRLAAMQRAKGRAAGVNLPDLPSEDESDQAPASARAGAGGANDLRAVRRERKEGRQADEERQRAWEERKAMLKRADKHAPMAMSATRPVSRKREVVEPPKIARRDPRFSSLSASNTDANLARASYAFLPGMLRDELASLRTALGVATKAERSAPAAERDARAAERERIEGELARVRSRVERTEREERERVALQRVKKAEWEKRAEGKGEWHMKRADKKQLLLEAKFSALEEKGGQRAVKKAIEKKQKKVAQKEKRSRPFARGMGGGGGERAGGVAPSGRRRV